MKSAGDEIVNTSDGNNIEVSFLSGMVRDSKNNFFLADQWSEKIFKMDSNGVMTPFVGGGESGTGTEKGYADGKGKSALFNSPTKLAIDKNDNIYVADSENHRIRKITPDGTVTTVAGIARFGNADGKTSEAQFHSPQGVAVDNKGNIFVADTGNNTIRQISQDGSVTTVAGGALGFADGTGTGAQFYSPNSIIFDGNSTLYVTDSQNNRIRKIELK